MEKNKEHKDSSGSKTGTSKERTDWLGNKYTEHKDSSGSKTGTSEEQQLMFPYNRLHANKGFTR